MIAAFVVGLAATFATQEFELAQMRSALGSLQRLAAAIPADKPGATEAEKVEYQAQKAEFQALLNYLAKMQDVMAIGKWDESYLHNMLIVTQQTVVAGQGLAVLPEEVLCWARAALNFAAATNRYVTLKVQTGALSEKVLGETRAAQERFKRQYRQMLEQVIANPH